MKPVPVWTTTLGSYQVFVAGDFDLTMVLLRIADYREKFITHHSSDTKNTRKLDGSMIIDRSVDRPVRNPGRNRTGPAGRRYQFSVRNQWWCCNQILSDVKWFDVFLSILSKGVLHVVYHFILYYKNK